MPNSDLLKKLFNLKNAITATYITVGVLAVINLIGSNTLATQGVELDQIHQRINQIDEANQEIKINISAATNMEKINSIAHQLGFIHTSQVYHLNAGGVVAYSTTASHE